MIALDRRGHGGSEIGPDGAHTMDRHGADIGDAIDALGLEDVTVVGQSMGGNAIWALLAAGADRRHPRHRDRRPDAEDAELGGLAVRVLRLRRVQRRHATSRPASPIPAGTRSASKGPVRVARLLRGMDLKAAKAGFTPAELELLNDHAKRDWRPTIAATTVPVLFIAGRGERVLAVRARGRRGSAHSARATSAVIEKAGHATNIEQPKAFDELLAARSQAELRPAQNALPGLRMPARVERGLDVAVHREHPLAELGARAGQLQQAHAVLAGDRAAERAAVLDDAVERVLRPGLGRVIALRRDDQRMQVAVARRGRWSRSRRRAPQRCRGCARASRAPRAAARRCPR